MSAEEPIKGGEFIIKNTEPKDIFTPEEWNEEHKMIAQMCDDFIVQEIIPHLDRIDSLEEGLMPSLLNKAGELGLLGLSVPEELGGMGVDFKTTLLATEHLGLDSLFLWRMELIQVSVHCHYSITEMKNKKTNTFQN